MNGFMNLLEPGTEFIFENSDERSILLNSRRIVMLNDPMNYLTVKECTDS